MHFSELLVVFIVAVLVFSPKRLPELAQTLGRFIRQTKFYSQAIKSEIHTTLEPLIKEAQLKDNEARAIEAEGKKNQL